MKKMTTWVVAAMLLAPSTALWAAAGDANLQGSGASTTGAPGVKPTHKHHGHHHNKKTPTVAPTGTSTPSNTSGTK